MVDDLNFYMFQQILHLHPRKRMKTFLMRRSIGKRQISKHFNVKVQVQKCDVLLEIETTHSTVPEP